MIKLEYIPNGIDEILDYYGNPGYLDQNGKAHINREWVKENLKRFILSFPLRKSWNGVIINGFYAHKKVGPAMVDALEQIKAYAGLEFLQRFRLDQWGGVYNPRFKKKNAEMSTHFLAISIDHCPMLGPFNEPSRMPHFIVEAFEERGFINLKFDGMHNQGCRSY